MEQISRVVEGCGRMGVNDVLEAVSGKREYKRHALGLLVAEGYVKPTESGSKRTHHSLIPYREDAENGGDGQC
jgi:hypothetical protein